MPEVAELRDVAMKDAEVKTATAGIQAPSNGSPTEPQLQLRTLGTPNAAESGNAPLKVDSEGGVQALESHTRFIGTAVALLITRRAADNDAGAKRGKRQ